MSRRMVTKSNTCRYKADITAGSLKLFESRAIADLLIRDCNKNDWDLALTKENILHARSIETAKRLSRLLKARLENWDKGLWLMIRDGDTEIASQACLAAAIKHSSLLGDFFDTVIRGHYRAFEQKLTIADWDKFIADCYARDPHLPKWSEETVKRLKSTVFQILSQTGYLENTRTLILQPVHIVDKLQNYLIKRDEIDVIKCMEVGQ